MEHIYAEKHSAIYLTNTDSLKEHFLFLCLEYLVYDKLFYVHSCLKGSVECIIDFLFVIKQIELNENCLMGQTEPHNNDRFLRLVLEI